MYKEIKKSKKYLTNLYKRTEEIEISNQNLYFRFLNLRKLDANE